MCVLIKVIFGVKAISVITVVLDSDSDSAKPVQDTASKNVYREVENLPDLHHIDKTSESVSQLQQLDSDLKLLVDYLTNAILSESQSISMQ